MKRMQVTEDGAVGGNESRRASVRVLFFGAAREAVGSDEISLNATAPASAASIRRDVLERFPPLARFGRSLFVAVNEQHANEDTVVNDGDEVAFFPPVSGGSSEGEHVAKSESTDFFALTSDPIDVGTIARRVVPPECGATVTFDGYVRGLTDGCVTSYLVYEAYERMALAEMRRLGARAREEFEVAAVSIVHRVGRLGVGETSVLIAVAAPHRRAAFQACE